MIWIKANKTKLYRLIAEHMFLPKMMYTKFIEADDRSHYILEWSMADNIKYRACFSIVDGLAQLSVQYCGKHSESYVNHTIHKFGVERLLKNGMLRGIRHERQLEALRSVQQSYEHPA